MDKLAQSLPAIYTARVKPARGRPIQQRELLRKTHSEYHVPSRLVMEELALEQQNLTRQLDEQKKAECKMMGELERLQEEVEHAQQSTDSSSQYAEALKFDITNLESVILEKKMQLERLVSDMKEANLQSLTVASQDEQIKYLLEGVRKPGSKRRIIGSPRQLETAVPTSKNPHGIWV